MFDRRKSLIRCEFCPEGGGEDRSDAIPDINSISISHYVIVLLIGVIIRKKKHFLAVLSLLSAMKKEPCVDESV